MSGDDYVFTGEQNVGKYTIDGRNCTSRLALMDEWSRVLAYPDYFGRNWDAFEECVCDLSWLPPSPTFIAVSHSCLLLDLPGFDFDMLMECLDVAVREQDRNLIICFCDSRQCDNMLWLRCENIGIVMRSLS
ncbi:MAG: barstar family protein [Phycisphaeraceae bacterium]|nr:barstar family protein [Phycisphaeraceae bacterium]